MVEIADFIEAPNSGGNYRKVLLVVHVTISPEAKGAARGVVRYWQRARTGSTQYVVDNAEIIQAVRETAYSWAAGTTANRWGIHVEHCGYIQSMRQWRDGYSTAELELSAALFAELSSKYGIPVRWLTPEQVRTAVATGKPSDGGICGHDTITAAFPGETNHSDPGKFFPRKKFLAMVRAAKKAQEPTPAPTPAGTFGQFTLGTHNLHDDAGRPTFFADAIGFTEAVAPTIRERARAKWCDVKGARDGYRLVSAPENRTIVAALARSEFKFESAEWAQAHGGRAKVTPARGTLVVRARHRATGTAVSFLFPHRINNAYPPFKRGEGEFRTQCWNAHRKLDQRLARQEMAAGRVVLAGGDMNTSKRMSAFDGVLTEVGPGLDRLAAGPGASIVNPERLGRKGSDHPRLRATVTLTSKEK